MPDYREIAKAAAVKYNLPPATFIRQIDQESGFNPTPGPGGALCNSAGACGIAQIVPKYHPGVDVSNPVDSLYYAAALMRSHLDNYGNMTEALIAYNAGGGGVDTYRRGGPYPSWFQQPIDYVRAILGIDISRGPGQVEVPSDNSTPATPAPADPAVPPTIRVPGTGIDQPSNPFAVPPVPSIFTGVSDNMGTAVSNLGQTVKDAATAAITPLSTAVNNAVSLMTWLGQTNIYKRIGFVVLGAILVLLGIVLFALSFIDKLPIPIPV